jgi:hypothetical protein
LLKQTWFIYSGVEFECWPVIRQVSKSYSSAARDKVDITFLDPPEPENPITIVLLPFTA